MQLRLVIELYKKLLPLKKEENKKKGEKEKDSTS